MLDKTNDRPIRHGIDNDHSTNATFKDKPLSTKAKKRKLQVEENN